MSVSSRLGFGVSGAHGTPLISKGQTVRLIVEAARDGVRLFDTAPAYGDGEAERRLGQAMKRLDRDALTLSTKAGLVGSGFARNDRDFSPEAIERSLKGSLSRLGVEGVDYLFLHGPAPSEWTPALIARLSALKAAGAFRILGAAGRGAELDPVIAEGLASAIMLPVHPFLVDAERERIQAASEAGLKVFAIETAGDAPQALRLPRYPSDLYALMKSVRSDGPGRGRVSVPEGLSHALSQPEVSHALFTTTKLHHLKANLALDGL